MNSEAVLQDIPSSDIVRASLKRLTAPLAHLINESLAIWSDLHANMPADIDSVIDVLARQIVAFLGGLCLAIPLIMMTFLTSLGLVLR